MFGSITIIFFFLVYVFMGGGWLSHAGQNFARFETGLQKFVFDAIMIALITCGIVLTGAVFAV